MTNRPHVPKFGDWHNQDQPFTAVFDNARTNKRQDLYGSLENSEITTQADNYVPTPPRPASRGQRPEPPRQAKEDKPRPPPPTEGNKVRAPPPDQHYGGGGGVGGGSRSGGGAGLYGGYGGGSDGSGGHRRHQQPPTPPRPAQPKPNRGDNNGRVATTIPPFPGSVGAGENMSYTLIFDQVKEERKGEGGISYGRTASTGNTPSRPINGQREPPTSTSSQGCCFPWSSRKGSKY